MNIKSSVMNIKWTVMNIKSSAYGVRKRENDAAPFTSRDDVRLTFLDEFVDWLQKWQMMDIPGGRLSKDTFHSLINTTINMKNIIEFCLGLPGIKYVLPGKFCTDRLERKFSSYRQLSGGNYNVSVTQVLESEKKIKVQQLLGIKSAQYKKVKLHEEMFEQAVREVNETIDDVLGYPDIYKDLILTAATQSEMEIDKFPVIYVSGYVTFKLHQKMSCQACINWLKSDTADNSMFEELNRGGLSIPSDIVLFVCMKVFIVMQHLISDSYERTFIKAKNQFSLLVQLSKALLNENMPELCGLDETCAQCGTALCDIIYKMLPYFCNILLKNYCKVQNDVLAANKGAKSLKRKLNFFE